MPTFDDSDWNVYSADTLAEKAKGLETTLAPFFGEAGEPQDHDLKRAHDFLRGWGFNGECSRKHAILMAKKITHPDKAYRRGKAFKFAGIIWWPIFLLRCKDLLTEV